MLVKENTRFPYPVLRSDTDDFTSGGFAILLDIVEQKGASNVKINYKVELNEPSIKELVDKGKAACGVIVISESTSFEDLKELDLKGGQLEFSSGELLGKVSFRGIIHAKDVCKIDSGIHKEFGLSWSFQNAEFLAIAEEKVAEIGQDKLVSMKTIFAIEEDDEVPGDEIRVVLDRDEISITANAKSCTKIHNMRNHNLGRATLFGSVYLPALIQVLDSIRGGNNEHEGRRWFRVLTSKCNALNINKDEPNLLEDAQKLLKSPLSHLFDRKELSGDE